MATTTPSAIINLLTEATSSAAGQRSCVSKLKKLYEGKGNNNSNAAEELVNQLLREGIDRILVCSKTDATIDRLTSALSTFFTTTSEEIFSKGIAHLLVRSQALDKAIRQKSCAMIANWLSQMTTSELITDEAINSIEKVLIPRLRDKIVGVRVAAIHALKSIQSADENGYELRIEFLRLMSSDPSKEVRQTATESIIVCTHTLTDLSQRIRDIEPAIRIAAINRLHNSIRHLSLDIRNSVLQQSLNDRNELVRQSAIVLICKWTEACKFDVPKLLRLLGLDEKHIETTKQVAKVICSELFNTTNNDNKIALLKANLSFYDNSIDWKNVIQPNNTINFGVSDSGLLLWTNIKCNFAAEMFPSLQKSELFDALLPDMIQLVTIIDALLDRILSSDEISINDSLCISQLFGLVVLMEDSIDSIGANAMRELCCKWLHNIHCPTTIVPSALTAFVSVLTLLGESFDAKIQQLIEFGMNLLPTEVIETETETIELSAEELEEEKYCKTFRGLQIISWTLQQNVGGMQTSSSFQSMLTSEWNLIEQLLRFIQSPNVELRYLTISCLSSLSLVVSKEVFQSNQLQDILVQACATTIEYPLIRAKALQTLSDCVVIGHMDNDTNNNERDPPPQQQQQQQQVIAVLLQKIFSENNGSDASAAKLLSATAIASTVKLLFMNRLSDYSLLSRVLTPYLLPSTCPVVVVPTADCFVDSAVGSSLINNSSSSSSSNSNSIVAINNKEIYNLQQYLSLFVSTYFSSAALSPTSSSSSSSSSLRERKSQLLAAISDILSETISAIRDEFATLEDFSRVLAQLMCLFKCVDDKETTVNHIEAENEIDRMRKFERIVCATLCKEMFKLGNSKIDISILKVLLQTITTECNLIQWINSDSAKYIQLTLSVVKRSHSKLDNTITALLSEIKTFCGRATKDESSGSSSSSFLALVPGFADLMATECDDDEEEVTANNSNSNEDADKDDAATTADEEGSIVTTARKPRKAATKTKAVSNTPIAAATSVGRSKATRAAAANSRSRRIIEDDSEEDQADEVSSREDSSDAEDGSEDGDDE